MLFKQSDKIGIRDVQQLQQPVLQLDIVLAMRKTQARRAFE